MRAAPPWHLNAASFKNGVTTGAGNLHIYKVNGCAGLIASGDGTSFKGSLHHQPEADHHQPVTNQRQKHLRPGGPGPPGGRPRPWPGPPVILL
jgi:hypothetical protein